MGNWFDKNKFFEKLLILTWVVFLFICIGLLSFTSHAESYFPMGQNDNNKIPQNLITYLDNNYGENYNVVFTGPYVVSIYSEFYIAYWPKSDSYNCYGEILSNGYQWSLYKVGNFNITYGKVQIKTSQLGTATPSGVNVGSYSYYFANRNSSLYDSSISYVSNFKIYTNNDPSTRSVVLSYGADDPLPIEQGHATEPDPFENPAVNSGSNHTLPREVPESPTINNYSWTTYNSPTIDTSTIESLLESLIYVINYLAGWLRDNLSGEFQNLISNIKGLFEYIGNTIQYYGGLIISNIQNGITTFYNNMVSLFEPISAKIDYLTEPVDGTVIYDNISSTSLVTNINTINTSLNTFQTSFNDLSEPNSFTIPIHLENLPSAYFGTQTTQYIDLGIIGSTEKGLIRTFMWALITYSLFITIVDSVSNYINGGGDES